MNSAPPPALRLVSFNILEGLRPLGGNETERRALDRRRVEAAQQVVRELRPDILVLNEALFCRAYDGMAVNYAALFDFPHEASALYDGAWGNAILSRHAILDVAEFRIHNRGGLRALIDTPWGALTVASYHPHPHRLPENKALDLDALIAEVTGPLILCGDFNCISPEDPIDTDALVAAFRRFTSNAEESVQRFIESGEHVFEALAKRGLHDAVPTAGRRYSIPTDLINTDKSSGMRIDHVLANAAIEVLGGEVSHSQASNDASDHHPVMVEFRIRAEA